jgi:hypothetical protein
MKINKILFSGLLFFGIQIYAQDAIVSSGGNSVGSNGNLSYSVGQVVYTTNFGSNASISQGVQQPFEIQTLLGVENFNIDLQLSVYPNPTANWLTLDIKNISRDNLQYQLFDLNGKLIISDSIKSQITTFQLESYPTSIYLLEILENNKKIKTYKIIKK